MSMTFDPAHDLVLERDIDVPPELVFKAWTTPEHLRHWFAPKPWTITECTIDLRPGGELNFTMKSPEGALFPNTLCFLDIVQDRRLVQTDTLRGGYRPSPNPFFTAVLDLTPTATGTHYRAVAMHSSADNRQRHAEMGFQEGWGTVLTQMVDYIKAGHLHNG